MKRTIQCQGLTVACLIFFFVSGLASADDQVQFLATLTNDRNPEQVTLGAIVDPAGGLQGLDMVNNRHDGNPPTIVHHTFPVQQIETEDGVVLDREQGRVVISLRGTLDADAGKGMLVVSFLSNGLFMNYDECNLNVERTPAGNWILVNAYNGQQVTEIRAITWALGISTLENVCPDN